MLPAAIGKHAGDATAIHPAVIDHANPAEAPAERPVGSQRSLHVVCGNHPDKVQPAGGAIDCWLTWLPEAWFGQAHSGVGR